LQVRDRTVETRATSEGGQKKRLLNWGIRLAVSAALLVFLLRGAQLSEFAELVNRADRIQLGVGLLLVVVALIVSAYKWQWLLIAQSVRVPLPKLFTSYLVGLFFNNFLPTNIGGDVVRMYDIAQYSGKRSEAVASVIGERLLASFALALTAGLGVILSYHVSGGFAGAVLGVFAVSGAVIGLFAVEGPRRAIGSRIRLPKAIGDRLSKVSASLALSFQNRLIVAWVIVLSLAFHATVVLLNHVIFSALGVHVSLVYCFMVIPIISAIQMLPISVNGLGVREGAYIYFFSSVGLSTPEAVLASLTFWALVAIVSLAGGAIFALRPPAPSYRI